MEWHFDQPTGISSASFTEGAWADRPLEDVFIGREPAAGAGTALLAVEGDQVRLAQTAAGDDFASLIAALLDQADSVTETSPETIEPVPALLDEADMDSGRQSADGEEVTVTLYYYVGDSGGGGGGGGLHRPEDDATSITPGEPSEPPPPAEPNPTPCVETTFVTPNVNLTDVNKAALEASNLIAARPDDQRYEYSSVVFLHNGRVGYTVPYTDRNPDNVAWVNSEILSRIPDGAIILAVVHSHPNREVIDDRVPSNVSSGQDVTDWDSYDQLVNWNAIHSASHDLPRGITVDANMLQYIYTNQDHKTYVYDKTDKSKFGPSCSLQ